MLRDPFGVTSASSSESQIEKPCQTARTCGAAALLTRAVQVTAHTVASLKNTRLHGKKKRSLAALRSVTGSSDEGLRQGLL